MSQATAECSDGKGPEEQWQGGARKDSRHAVLGDPDCQEEAKQQANECKCQSADRRKHPRLRTGDTCLASSAPPTKEPQREYRDSRQSERDAPAYSAYLQRHPEDIKTQIGV
ncbi:hypothetical protein GCM10009784_11140 [Arthrobacter parietis]|uniref:Uncharacterized protein n=1 Tax=Arthrobacter parietis TaxID=271434 RepID=A0ABP5MM57_9MICC